MSDKGGDKGGAANSVGGARVARRPGRGSGAQGRGSTGSGAAGFFNADGGVLRVGPTTVLIMSLGFMLSVVTLHVLGKFKAIVSGQS